MSYGYTGNIFIEEVNGEERIYDEDGNLLEIRYGNGESEIICHDDWR